MHIYRSVRFCSKILEKEAEQVFLKFWFTMGKTVDTRKSKIRKVWDDPFFKAFFRKHTFWMFVSLPVEGSNPTITRVNKWNLYGSHVNFHDFVYEFVCVCQVWYIQLRSINYMYIHIQSTYFILIYFSNLPCLLHTLGWQTCPILKECLRYFLSVENFC